MNEKIRTIREFIVETCLFGEQPDLDPTISLLRSGVIDSTGVLELVLFIEETYGISVGDDEILPENLDSIERVAQFVDRKLAGLV